MLLEPIAGVDLLAAVGEVGVLSVALRPAAGKVLGHGGDAVGSDPLALQAGDIGPDQPGGEVWVLSEGGVAAGPAGLCGEVDLGVQGHPQPHRQVLPSDRVGEAGDEVGIVDGG